MRAKKVENINSIPTDKLADLQTLLITDKKDYIAIGKSIYEVYPLPAVKLMHALSVLVDILDMVRKRKINKLYEVLTEEEKKEFKASNINVVLEDIISDTEAVDRLSKLLPEVLEGIEEEDLEVMTIGQLMDAMDKIVLVNIDTLPPSYKRILEEKQRVLKEGSTVNPTNQSTTFHS